VRTGHHHAQTKTVLSYATPGHAEGSGYQEFALLMDPTSVNMLIHGKVQEDGEGQMRTGITMDDGEWHFVAFTWRAADGRVQAFKDGALSYLAGGYKTGTTLTGGGSMMAGQLQASSCSTGSNGAALCSYAGGFGFEGELQNIRIWGRELSNAELLHGLAWPFEGSQVSDTRTPQTPSTSKRPLTPVLSLSFSSLLLFPPILFPPSSSPPSLRSTSFSIGVSNPITTILAPGPLRICLAKERPRTRSATSGI
jgi:hypothetical protein